MNQTRPNSVTVRSYPPRSPAKDLALIAIFAGITAALGLLPPIPVGIVPITAQTLGPMLAGSILGGRRGFSSQLLFVVLVIIGLPLLSTKVSGLAVFASPTIGFVLAMPIVAGLIGWLSYRFGTPYRVWIGIVVNIVFAIFVLYGFGIIGMIFTTKMTIKAALLANLIFIPGDIVKTVIASLIAKGVHGAYPRLLPNRRLAKLNAESDDMQPGAQLASDDQGHQ